ncbi:DUF2793 domain-containing protein [Sinorhizobium medicae]|nr:DUF2793 domain-containing protein [Sinorhizobium medicae]
MPKKSAPGLGLGYGFNLGESGPAVKEALDDNAVRLSALVNLSVKSRTAPLPGSPVDGDRYIVPSDAGANANSVAVRVDAVWKYLVPQRNWVARVEDAADAEVVFNGSAWVAAATPGGGGSKPSVGLTAVATSTANTTDDLDFVSLTVLAADLAAGAVFEALFFGTQSQAAVSQNLVFYVKVNDGAAITIGSVGAGSTAQNFRAISGRAMVTLMSLGASGTYTVAGDLTINGLAPFSSNSATPRAVDTSTRLKLTFGIRCSVANAANINNITGAAVKQVV